MLLSLCFPCLYLLIFHPIVVACSCSNAPTRCPGSSINITSPFAIDYDSKCRGSYLIHCNDSTPTIQLGGGIGHSYTIVSIYENVLTIKDPDLSKLMQRFNCSFLYEFTEPYPQLDLARFARYLASKYTSTPFNCSPSEHDFSHIFDGLKNFTPCEDYNLHYLFKVENQSIDRYCMPSSPPLFEWKLSFGEGNNGFSLRSAGFSKQLVLYRDCFHCHIVAGHCTNDAVVGNDGCGCSNICTAAHSQLRDGRVVAVKRLYENNLKRVEQFLNEVEILSRLRHPNLVTLYGCTSRRSRELLLVYEFVPNGTVADHLHGTRMPDNGLTWPIRLSIAIETAEALAYLHAAETQIIHRDVKTTNILLDSNFRVKVADFGLSRLFPLDATHVSTLPQGTPGYVDPEYHQCYQLTDKSDVYSFGVVLVELISSMPAVDINRHRHEINLANLAINKIQNREVEQLVDPRLVHGDWEIQRMTNMVAEVAFRCLQADGEMRPSIKEVLEELRRIDGRGEKGVDAAEIGEDEVLFSPDSVTVRWESRTTTPNTSA